MLQMALCQSFKITLLSVDSSEEGKYTIRKAF